MRARIIVIGTVGTCASSLKNLKATGFPPSLVSCAEADAYQRCSRSSSSSSSSSTCARSTMVFSLSCSHVWPPPTLNS